MILRTCRKNEFLGQDQIPFGNNVKNMVCVRYPPTHTHTHTLEVIGYVVCRVPTPQRKTRSRKKPCHWQGTIHSKQQSKLWIKECTSTVVTPPCRAWMYLLATRWRTVPGHTGAQKTDISENSKLVNSYFCPDQALLRYKSWDTQQGSLRPCAGPHGAALKRLSLNCNDIDSCSTWTTTVHGHSQG